MISDPHPIDEELDGSERDLLSLVDQKPRYSLKIGDPVLSETVPSIESVEKKPIVPPEPLVIPLKRIAEIESPKSAISPPPPPPPPPTAVSLAESPKPIKTNVPPPPPVLSPHTLISPAPIASSISNSSSASANTDPIVVYKEIPSILPSETLKFNSTSLPSPPLPPPPPPPMNLSSPTKPNSIIPTKLIDSEKEIPLTSDPGELSTMKFNPDSESNPTPSFNALHESSESHYKSNHSLYSLSELDDALANISETLAGLAIVTPATVQIGTSGFNTKEPPLSLPPISMNLDASCDLPLPPPPIFSAEIDFTTSFPDDELLPPPPPPPTF